MNKYHGISWFKLGEYLYYGNTFAEMQEVWYVVIVE